MSLAFAAMVFSFSAFGDLPSRSLAVGGAPFDMPAISESVFPARDFSIADYGARPDGSVCTEAFAKAMAACEAAGGGRVVVPKGTWLTGAVHFRSGCELHFEDGAILEFTDNPDDYPEVETTWEGVECLAHSPLLFGYRVTDVAITGKGLIRPRMKLWRDWFERPPEHMKLTEMLYHWCSTNAPMSARRVLAAKGANVRPHLIQFNQAKNVRIEGVTIRESPFWTVHLYRSENCILRGIDMSARGHNNDGIDIDMTRNVLVEDCTLAQGDDGICLKAGRNQDAWRINRPTENVVVRRCRIRCATTLLGIGSELSGGIRNVWVTDCDVDAAGILFRVKTNRRRGGFVRDVWMDHCRVGETARILLVEMDVLYQWANFPDYEIRRTPIENLNISDVICEQADIAFHVIGDPLLKPRNVNIRNISIGSVTEDYMRLSDCDEVTTDNVRLGRFDSSLRYPFSGRMPFEKRLSDMSDAHGKAVEFLSRPNLGALKDGRYELGGGAVAEISRIMLRPCSEASFVTDYANDTMIFLFSGEDGAYTTKATSIEHVWAGRYGRQFGAFVNQYVFIPAGVRYADRLIYGNPQPTRRCVVKIPHLASDTCFEAVGSPDRAKVYERPLDGLPDVAAADGVTFDFTCDDPTAVLSSFVCFRSGAGSYLLPFSVRKEDAGRCVRYAASRASALTEGKPAGWSHVESTYVHMGMRRGARTKCRISPISVVPSDSCARVAVVIPETSGGSDNVAGGPAATSMRNVSGAAAQLVELGVPFRSLTEGELTASRLVGVTCAVLPANGRMDGRAVDVLREFVRTGGKLLVLNEFAPTVAVLMGLRVGTPCVWRLQDEASPRIVRTSESLPGLPEASRFLSYMWTLPRLELVGEGEVLAEWQGCDGEKTGLAAILRTPAGIAIGLVPWRGGTDATLGTLDSALCALVPELAASRQARAEARLERDAGRLKGVADQMPRFSHHGVWSGMDGAWGDYDWERTADWLKGKGFTDVYACVGTAARVSTELEAMPGVERSAANRGDLLRMAGAACHRRGIRLHAYKICWRVDDASDEMLKELEGKGRLMRTADGKVHPWLCPSHPENLRHEYGLFMALADKDVDGVHLDYVRYPMRQRHCFCPGCRERLEKRLGRTLPNWPAEVLKDGAFRRDWLEFRKESVSALVKMVAEGVHAKHPGKVVSAAVFRYADRTADEIGQDWSRWCREGWLDEVLPMTYVTAIGELRDDIAICKAAVEGSRTKLYPGLAVTGWLAPGTAADTALFCEQMREVGRAGLDGFTAYVLGDPRMKALYEVLMQTNR